MEAMTESPELTALRQKLAQIENELDVNRRLIGATSTLNAILAGHRSECFKQIAKLVKLGQEPLGRLEGEIDDPPPRLDWLER